jgi:hypothetical protein
MYPPLSWESVEAMVADRRRHGREKLAAAADVTVRLASEDDAASLERLAELDSGTVPEGPTLVAEVHGDVVAALPVSADSALADPFSPTAAVVRVLQLRAAELRRPGVPSPDRR